MKKLQHKCSASYLFAFTFLFAVCFCNGCGIVSVLGTPGRHERKITAEYDLAERADQKIIVLVKQPPWLNAQVNFRYHLTKRINAGLIRKVDIPPECIVSYEELSVFRAGRADFASLSPIDVGVALNAETVLFVMINDCTLKKIGEMDYYEGSLSVRCVLHDATSGKKLWPTSAKGKSVKVGFEVESHGREAAVNRR
jgi:hypothetical protein